MTKYLVTFERARNRLSVQGLVAGQVFHGDNAADLSRGIDDGLGNGALVEDVPRCLKSGQAVTRDCGCRHGFHGVGQARLDQSVAGLRQFSIVIEHVPAAGGIVVELGGGVGVLQAVEHVLVVRDAILGVVNSRGQDLVDGHAAVALKNGDVRRDDTRDCEGKVGVLAGAGGDALEPL